jgi:microsomal dipeptidase-like Zn-dependent dipeptidase
VQRLFDAGFRQIALTHNFDNGLAGSSEGCSRSGLTPLGEAVIAKAERLGMVVDLAHLSSPALQQAARLARAPVVVSHTGAQGSCQTPCYPPRNLTDADIRAVARTGGTIGIGYWPAAVGNGLESIVKTTAYVASVLNQPRFLAERRHLDPAYDPFDHIALGSDFDGFVSTPIDTSQLALLTAAVRQAANTGGITFTYKQVPKIAGGNVCRIFAERLPGGSARDPATICP